MNKTLFQNAKLILPGGITPGSLLVEGPSIQAILPPIPHPGIADLVIDLGGLYLSPGFIDIHTHGGGGADFMDATPDAVYSACKAHMLHGTTSIVPTNLASTRELLFDFVDFFEGLESSPSGCPSILGLHLEGPYFSPGQRGAQDIRYLRKPLREEYEHVLRRSSKLRRWSFAPELDDDGLFLKSLRKQGIISSLAHSDASYAQVEAAVKNGLEALTHFYSCMSSVHRVNAFRVAGAVEAGYLIDELYVEVIADGCHLPAELLKLIYRVKGAERICLVTDSMRAAGTDCTRSFLGGIEDGTPVIVEDGVAKLCDRSAFAGSVATADRLVRTFRDLTGAPLHEVVSMMSATPAKLMRVDQKKGSIAVGKDADLVVFDEIIGIKMVMVMGRLEVDHLTNPRNPQST